MTTLTRPPQDLARSLRDGQRSPFDFELLSQQSSQGTSCSRTMLQKFATRAGDQMAGLNRAANSGNAVELAQRAHTLKDIASGLAAADLQASAAQLERMAQACKLEQAGSLLERVQFEIQRCLKAAPQLLGRLGQQSSGDA